MYDFVIHLNELTATIKERTFNQELMGFSNAKEIDSLINDHFTEFRAGKSVLDLLVKSQNVIFENKKILPFENKISQLKFLCFLSASFIDLLCILKGFFNSTTEWEKIHFSKTGYLLIYEIIKNYDTNKKSLLDGINNEMPELIPIFNKNAELLKAFKKEFDYEGKIKNIRHKSSGHIDKEFLAYFEAISLISSEECKLAIENCLGFLKLLMMILHDLTLTTTENEVTNPNHPNLEYWEIIREEMKQDPELKKYAKS